MGKQVSDKALRALDMQVLENIESYGVHLTGVFGTEEDPIDSPFVYTTGLVIKHAPEVIVFGLDFTRAGMVLNSMCAEVFDGDLELREGISDGVLRDLPVFFLRVDPDKCREHLTMSNRFAEAYGVTTPVQALQLVWPDKDCLFPWEEGYSIPASAQPLLGPAPERGE